VVNSSALHAAAIRLDVSVDERAAASRALASQLHKHCTLERVCIAVRLTAPCRRAAAKLQKLFQIGKKVNVYVGEPVDVSYIINKWKQVCITSLHLYITHTAVHRNIT
jgi:hypothetical protein